MNINISVTCFIYIILYHLKGCVVYFILNLKLKISSESKFNSTISNQKIMLPMQLMPKKRFISNHSKCTGTNKTKDIWKKLSREVYAWNSKTACIGLI